MSNTVVEVRVGHKIYKMNAPQGQESRVESVAARFDEFVQKMQNAAGGTMDRDQILVLAGIMMADEFMDKERSFETRQQTVDAFHDTLAKRLTQLMDSSV